jgi:hypothetical protein
MRLVTPPMSVRASPDRWLEKPSTLVLLFFAFGALLFSRYPPVLLHAELWGEDGWNWYPDAYRIGFASLLLPDGGYLNSFQRLVAIAVQPLPLAWVPTVFAAVALLTQSLPAVFLVSSRMAPVWPNARARLAFALLYLALPDVQELYCKLTNTHWHLALMAFLILVSAPPKTWTGRAFDAVFLLLSGLSGPFCLILLPVAFWELVVRRDRTSAWRAGFLVATAAVQTVVLLQAGPHAGRSSAPLGAGPRALARILALQIMLQVELGLRTATRLLDTAAWQTNILPMMLTTAGAALAIVGLLRGSPLLRKFCLFTGVLLGTALLSPLASLTGPQWPVLATPLAANRYFTFPMLAWTAILFTLAGQRTIWHRAVAGLLLASLCIWAIPREWSHYLQLPSNDFVSRARAFENAPSGTRAEFPVFPGRSMVLIKR